MDFRSRLAIQQVFNFEELIEKAHAGEFLSFEFKLNQSPKRERWFNVRIFPAKNEEGEIFGVSLNLADITSHKEAELILTETERKLLALFSATSESLVLFDLELKVKFFNQRLLQLPSSIKAAGNIVVGSGVDDLGLQIPNDQIIEMLEAAKTGMTNHRDFCVVSTQDEVQWWSVTTYPALQLQGDFLGALMIIEDVSAEYWSKQEILERHNQLRELAQIHSHEVRKPLANV